MNCINNNVKLAEINFYNYISNIKNELLDQIISEKSNSRSYCDTRYYELFYKYVRNVNTKNYNEICCKFVRDVYQLIPVTDRI